MRFSLALLLLPALQTVVAADVQIPLQERVLGWLELAKSYIPIGAASSTISAASSAVDVAATVSAAKDEAAGWYDKAKAYIPTAVASPGHAAASAVAAKQVTKININNWERKLVPSPDGPTDWMVLTTGNKSCYGMCEQTNRAWNQSIPLLSAYPDSPNLATINCDVETVLCAMWLSGIPSLWHFHFPQATRGASNIPAGQPTGPVEVRIMMINTTTISPQDFVKVHSEKTILNLPVYHGVMNPIDGQLAQYGLLKPLGYAIWAFGSTPSWLIMIGISFLSRQVMARRMGTGLPPPARNAAGAAARKNQ